MDKQTRLQELRSKSAAGIPSEQEDIVLALKALQALAAEQELPIHPRDIKTSKYPIAVPHGFSSLFSDLWIEVSWGTRGVSEGRYTANVGWSYEHPRGGTNGYSLGFITKNPDGQWGWQTSQGKWGVVK